MGERGPIQNVGRGAGPGTVADLWRSHRVDEILDIFDEYMHQIGTASRLVAHRTGAWHQTFHCWALHRTQTADYLLLQRRHESKDTHPDKLDVSCGGHLEAGETPSDGVRELNEELGIEVDFISLFPVGVHRYAADFGDVKDREFCHVFVLVRTGETLSGYTPATGEVSGLYLIRVDEMEKLCLGEVEAAPIAGFEVDAVGRRLDRSIEIGRNDLVWHGASYFHIGYDVIVSLLPLQSVPRALVNRQTAGVFKPVADAKTRKVLGAHVVGVNAGEVIYAATLAVKFGLTI